ncbi:MAG: DUF2946 family protein [Pusillimonas sp.]
MAAWQILFCLAMVSLLYRSAIPAGYMPDFSGGGGFSITLCSVGGGPTVMPLDLADESGKHASHDGVGGQDCPFGLMASQAAMPGHDALALERTTSFHRVVAAIGSQALPPLPALGPPLGSRAPPSNLG